jgi:hypothetical protein
MELLRLPPNPLELELTGFQPGLPVAIAIYSDKNEVLQPCYFAKDDTLALEKENFFCTEADGGGVVELTLPHQFTRYDREYTISVYDNSEGVWDYETFEQCYTGMFLEHPEDDLLFTENLRIYRPYIDIEQLAPSEDKVARYVNAERLARLMIDNIVGLGTYTGGFYYRLQVVDLQGLGTDRLTIGDRANKLLRLDENNRTVYLKDCKTNEKQFKLNSDKNCIVPWYPHGEHHNRLDRRLPRHSIPGRSSDATYYGYNYGLTMGGRAAEFKNGYNYTAWLECGWPMVPQDIQDCTALIINDMVCGAPNYWSQYVNKYETKDFKITFDTMRLDGTGNRIVDQTLMRYFGDQLYSNVRVL